VNRLLVDTHVFLWMLLAPERLGSLRAPLESQRTEVLLSAASSWEIAVKWALGRLQLPDSPSRYVPEAMRRSATTGLPVSHAHALAVADLPPHHSDPFDRLLLAQSIVDRVPLVTADEALRPYEADIRWVT
jgi:PIN domain nuclease of toxin-antitoxin system